ncbi:hypothetical protein GXW82_23295 [Streptacidiphilus sp. 4-A2]|nr:hypothetical protein [Streptacidiphilus sp. 4-A2]
MLTRHTAQGRDLRWSVLSWFRGVAMEHATDGEPAPQPPMEAVKEALAWALPQLAAVRFLSMAAQAHTEEQADAFHIYAENQRHQWGRPHLLDPEGLRGHILAGQDAPSDAANRGTGTALIHLSAAAGLGGQGIGADLLAEALAGSGLLPQVSREMWEEVLTQAELEGRPLVPENLIVDPLERALLASGEDLLKARDTAVQLSGYGSLLVMHGLLLPRTPGLDLLFRLINDLGVGQALIGMAAGCWKPQSFAQTLVVCFDPYYAWLCNQLAAQVAAGPPLFRRAGEDTAEAFMQDWLASIKDLSSRDASDCH